MRGDGRSERGRTSGTGAAMRLMKVTFRGYKRLADTGCNFDGRLLALVGPNEIGKSSLLEALGWLTEEDSGPLPPAWRSRSATSVSDDDPVVEAQFALESDDLAAISHLDVGEPPRIFGVQKYADGSYRAHCDAPLRPTWRPLDRALGELRRFEEQHGALTEAGGGRLPALLGAVRGCLQQADAGPRQGAAEVRSARDWCRQAATRGNLTDDTVSALRWLDLVLAEAEAALRVPSPNAAASELLRARVPRFLLFGHSERFLQSEYNLDDPDLAAAVPGALVNLLALAGTDMAEVRGVRASGDTAAVTSYLAKVNQRLSGQVRPTWRQATLAVSLELDGPMMRVRIEEAAAAVTSFAERSDGLKTFIALICFLARHRTEVPPVLMLDEAETHLHYDAQADLVEVLQHQGRTSTVLYTTHSPGCLPHDLGTGIRLVAPDRKRAGASALVSHFWANDQPGFSPLLFAMGAGAAAFSVCRRAVIAEGPSDMILLPTLIRAATGEPELGYQVAPGLSTASAGRVSSAAVAATTAYLVDGDSGGRTLQKDLKAVGVKQDRIFSLPDGCAMEDLLDPAYYLRIIGGFLSVSDRSALPPVGKLPQAETIAKRVEKWCETTARHPPGKTVVASRIVQDPTRVLLTPAGRSYLVGLHQRLKVALA